MLSTVLASGNVPLRLALNAVTGVLWLGGLLWVLPYHSARFTDASAACASVYLFSVAAVALQALAGPERIDGSAVFYTFFLLAAGTGVALSRARRSWIERAPLQALRSPFEWQHRIRAMMQAATLEALRGRGAGSSSLADGSDSDGGGERSPFMSGSGSLPPTALHTQGGRPHSAYSRGAKSQPAPQSAISCAQANIGQQLLFGAGTRSPRARGSRSSGQDAHALREGPAALDAALRAQMPSLLLNLSHLEISVREETVRDCLPPAVLEQAESLYRLAAARFSASSVLFSFRAAHAAIYSGDNRRQVSHYIQALRLKPALDVEFAAYRARRQQEAARTATGTMSILSRIAYDKHLGELIAGCRRLPGSTASCSLFASFHVQSGGLSAYHVPSPSFYSGGSSRGEGCGHGPVNLLFVAAGPAAFPLRPPRHRSPHR